MAERIDVYADSLQTLLRAEDPTGSANDELFRVAQAFESSDQLRTTLSDASVPAGRRQQVVEELLGGRVSPITNAIVSLIVGAGRAADLPKIVDAMAHRSAAARGRQLAEVRTAVALTDAQEERLGSALEKAIGSPVDLKVIIDPTVVGGAVAQIGDTVIDGSLRSRLVQLRDVL